MRLMSGVSMYRVFIVMYLFFISFCAAPSFAQDTGDVVSILTVSRVVTGQDGKEARAPAATAKPGDVLEYVAEYRNTGKAPAKKLEATLPIPAGTDYVPDSASPAGASASLDGTKFEPVPLKRKVKQPDNKVVEQLVPYVEYRFIRWPPQDLGTGKSLKYSARAKMTVDAPPAASPAKQ